MATARGSRCLRTVLGVFFLGIVNDGMNILNVPIVVLCL
jgi:hypothetical protein